jgi:hypothetical protein
MTNLKALAELDSIFDLMPGVTTADHPWCREYIIDGIPLWARENGDKFEFSVSGTASLTHYGLCLGTANVSRSKDLATVKKDVIRRLITTEIKNRYQDTVTRYQAHLDYINQKETVQQKCHELLGEKYRPKGYNNHHTSNYQRGIYINVATPTSVKLTFEVHPDLVEPLINFRESLRK